MASTTDRRAARERLRKDFEATLDRLIPADESQPLRGGKFVEWEDQAEQFAESLCPAFLEERSALEDTARMEEAGRCPHCGSENVRLESRTVKSEVHSRHGPVVLHQERCRCRSCDRTFSPSGS